MDVCPNTCQNTNVYFGPLVTGEREEIDKVIIMTHIWPTQWSKTCLNNSNFAGCWMDGILLPEGCQIQF